MMNEANDNDKKKGGKKRENCFSPKILLESWRRQAPSDVSLRLSASKQSKYLERK